MYAALFEIKGWMGVHKYIFEGKDATELIAEFEKIQDLSCLANMGRFEEKKNGQRQIKTLEDFLDKYYDGNLTIDDIKDFNVKLSIGYMKCLEIADNDMAISKMKKDNPEAW